MVEINAVIDLPRWLVVTCGGVSSFALFSSPYIDISGKTHQRPTVDVYGSLGLGLTADQLAERDVEAIKKLYDLKIGEVGSYWDANQPIDYAYAKIKLGDVFDYYTTINGTLQVPKWNCFKLAVDEYLSDRKSVV